jgi:hypothetical protein
MTIFLLLGRKLNFEVSSGGFNGCLGELCFMEIAEIDHCAPLGRLSDRHGLSGCRDRVELPSPTARRGTKVVTPFSGRLSLR